MMYRVPAVLNSDEVAAFNRELDKAPWIDGRATVGAQGAQVKNNQQIDTRSEIYAILQATVLKALQNSPLFFAAALPKNISSPLFNRYQQNETYGFHVDGAVRNNGESGWMRTDLSATLFLCEPESYEGGELVVNDTYGQHSVKLPAGDLILYPSKLCQSTTNSRNQIHLPTALFIQSQA